MAVAVATAAVLALPTPAGAASTAPVHAGDFPDPFVMRVGATFYAYATQTGADSVQRMQSPDTARWQGRGNALPVLPPWAEWGHTWAPSVLRRGLTYVLYYTARDRASGRQCISRAVSLLPQGPYVDASLSPWLCQLDRGGSIDPYAYVDDGVPYLSGRATTTPSTGPPASGASGSAPTACRGSAPPPSCWSPTPPGRVRSSRARPCSGPAAGESQALAP